jgi:hypothetical protein
MLRKLMGRKRQSGEQTDRGSVKEDKAIIHHTVPDEVLYPDRPAPSAADMSWLDTAPVKARGEDNSTPPAFEPSAPAQEPAPAPAVSKVAPVRKVEPPAAPKPVQLRALDMAPNARTDGRPRFPYGWLVVVEGPGTGEWFPLERGMSHIGSSEGQTVQLDFGDAGVVQDRHAALGYDEERHAFVVSSDAAFRVNGVEQTGAASLRDGDVFTVSGTSLRLVALCSQNFHWAEHIAAE